MTVGDDGAVALPADVMREAGVRPGWRVRLVLDDGGVTITRVPERRLNREKLGTQ